LRRSRLYRLFDDDPVFPVVAKIVDVTELGHA
jgi:hypothetical protein